MTLLFFSLLLLATPAAPQIVGGDYETVYQWNGTNDFESVGSQVASAGDVNNDGYDDIIIGVRSASPGGLIQSGSAFVYSGFDGSLLHQWNGTMAGDLFGHSVSAAGDLNNDGHADLLVGAVATNPGGVHQTGSAYAYSGIDGSLLLQWDGSANGDNFGSAVSSADDINNDGTPDVLVGAPFASPSGISSAGSAYLYSGADGSLIYQWDGSGTLDSLGWSLGECGDTNHDGFNDVLIGAFLASPGGQTFSGSAYLYSGADGTLLLQWNGVHANDRFSRSLSCAGDVNADGTPDVIIGATAAAPGGVANAGSAYVYSGTDGALLYQWDGTLPGEIFGVSVSNAGDLDLDGFDDVLIGAESNSQNGYTANGAAFAYSGADGGLIHSWSGASDFEKFGSSVAAAGNINGDSYPDIIVGAAHADSNGYDGNGTTFIFGFNPFLNASANTLSASATSLVALELDFPMGAAFDQYRVLITEHGAGTFHYGVEIPLPLNNQVLRSYFGDYSFLLNAGMQGTLDANGDAIASIGLLAGSASGYVGKTMWLTAIANQNSQLPEYSSIAVAIEILP